MVHHSSSQFQYVSIFYAKGEDSWHNFGTTRAQARHRLQERMHSLLAPQMYDMVMALPRLSFYQTQSLNSFNLSNKYRDYLIFIDFQHCELRLLSQNCVSSLQESAHRFLGVENQTSAQASSLVDDNLMARIVNIWQAEVQLRSLSPERASSPVRHLEPQYSEILPPDN